MHSGGIADKVGNRYEARWTIHQLLGLLDGSISSIAIEALGGAEQGFEFSLVRNGTKEWHQCKRQTTAATWSINNLATAGVLSTFTRKLTSDVGRCVFVSSDNAKQIQLLQDKLPAASVLADFEASLSEAETQHWSVLQQRLPEVKFDKTFSDAVEQIRLPGPGGKVMHATLKIGDSMLMLTDEWPEHQSFGPNSLKGSPVTIHHYVEDVDASFKQAVEAGATVVLPVTDMFWGDRYGQLKDPFGHSWSLATHKRDLSKEEIEQAMAAMK